MVLSGAGLSAESGLKTFRDHDGLWEEYDVMRVCSTQGWKEDRALVTQFYNARRKDLKEKEPNRAHIALAELQKRYPGQIYNLTQNVDNLLEKAGCKEVVHLHGTLTDLRCEECGYIWDVGYESQRLNDVCPACKSGRIRHNVVMFGEAAPEYRHIYEAVEACDLFIALGTSGHVIDIVPIASEFKDSLLINPKREKYVTSFGFHERNIDEYFSRFIQKKAGEAADEMVEIVESFMKGKEV